MWHVGVDLGRKDLYIAAVHDNGSVRDPITICCSDCDKIGPQRRDKGA